MSLPAPRNVREGTLPTRLQIINKPSAKIRDDKTVEISNVQYIGSYNWIDRKTPSIIVPGSPKEWVDKPMPIKLERDIGIVIADQNGYRIPDAILLPLIVAVNIKAGQKPDSDEPNFDWPSIDFVTDRNNLRKLHRWIDSTENSPEGDFRIDLQLAGTKTILMNRWSKSTREMAGAAFGHNFEETMTTSAAQCEEGTGHHRIVSYDMNGLKMVVRFEVDAYVPSITPQKHNPSRSTKSSNDLDDLVNTFANVSLASKSRLSESDATFHSGLSVYSAGSWSVPQSSLVEMTTRSFRNYENMNWSNVYPQLFFSQTQHLFIGVHRQGHFTRLVKERLDSESMKKRNRAEQPKFKMLRCVLEFIQKLVIEKGHNARLSLVCEGGILGVYERTDADDCLPEEIMEYFDSPITGSSVV